MTLIAVKHRLLLLLKAGFMWSEGHVTKLATSHCTINSKLCRFTAYLCFVIMTHTEKCTVTACRTFYKYEKEATFFMASQVMRIILKAYDHQLLDNCALKIVDTVKKAGSKV